MRILIHYTLGLNADLFTCFRAYLINKLLGKYFPLSHGIYT